MSQSVAVIGAGVAATSVIHWLKILRPLDRIVQFSSDNLAPAASYKSTAVAALRGTRTGLSALGDELCEHWQFSDQFYHQGKHAGVVESVLETWLSDDKELRRFAHVPEASASLLPARVQPRRVVREKCWMIDPQVFLASFDGSHEQHSCLVTGLQPTPKNWLVKTQQGEWEFTKVILCTGVWQRWLKGLVPAEELATLVPSQGSYFEWQEFSLGEKSFALSFQGINLHYRHDIQTLQLGATTIKNNDSFSPARDALLEIRKTFEDHCELNLDFSQAQIQTGIRSILKSRRPFAGPLAPGLFALNGLYKNGWISAWPLAKKLCSTFE